VPLDLHEEIPKGTLRGDAAFASPEMYDFLTSWV
jgi:hypothetical protein